ncbi:cyclic nucleotide-binding domain-containing protein [Granulosicoccus antarcticus]|uniref:Putative NTE family protein n=1 Tax=Granulosicoccus antarcticus IMCC3135 TaxID=1192854 RepID=A0A2Z2NZ99_9GAMM|nr:cyclic nucleotide-binding domain-containing protein [Granulosicoccus antarcticus]ASJ75108.1 putative NTE family protein [Granulosicoccus antarcticus IMCC3135]
MNDARAKKQLKKLPLLKGIDESLWDRLIPFISFTDLAEGETLFMADQDSQNLYLVVDGELGLYMPCGNSTETFYLQSRIKGETAGDFTVLNGGRHLVTAIAVRKSCIALFPRFSFDQLTNIDPGILAHVYDAAALLSRRVTLARAFLELFGDVSNATMDKLLEKTVTRHYHSGEVLFQENEQPDGLYVIVSGKLIIESTDAEGQLVRIGEVRAPETVGELALLADSTRTATVTAARESTVAMLNREAFDTLVAPRADMMIRLSRLIVRRHVNNVQLEDTPRTDCNFVILPLDSRLPLRRFSHQLRNAMRELGDCMSLDSRSFDTLYGRSGASQTSFDNIFNSAIAEWLDDKENRFDSLMFIADREWTPWTQRCVNRADRILLLVDALPENSAEIREREQQLNKLFSESRIRPKVDLVLLHPSNTRFPKDTARWLNKRDLDAFYHVRINDPLQFSRLARRLQHKARGIVFSGGGARGYAHLGVQRLIEEQSVNIDYIGGSSMGGLLGAAMAMGRSYKDIESLSAAFACKQALFDYTLPLVSLMKSAKLTRFCKDVYGHTLIEDLWTPFFCISSNLADGREVIHDQGPLWKVVRSTISLPGVFSPVPTTNGDLLIDGAVLNTFPVDVMHERLGGRGNIIGVNVSHIPEQFHYYDFGTSLSGWQVLLSRLNPFADRIRIPRIAETLLRATDIKSIERLNEARRSLEVLIEPNVRSISLLDFKSYAQTSELGYQEARKVFARHGLCPEVATETVSPVSDDLTDAPLF